MSKADNTYNWITLSNYMPRISGLYIITYENKSGRHTDVAIYDLNQNRWFWDEDEERIVSRKILAWQELPPPYRPEAEINN